MKSLDFALASHESIIVRPPEGAWQVAPEFIGKTVASALRELHGSLSWKQVRECIERRCVSINGVLCLDETRRVLAGDRLELAGKPGRKPDFKAAVQLCWLDDSVIVVEKPAGMISLRHVAEIDWPAEKRLTQPSLDEVSLQLLSERMRSKQDLASLPAKKRRQHVRSVHRLDRETSGLVVFARSVAAEQALVAQFAAHSVDRVYQAVVWGQVDTQTVTTQFVRDRGDGLRGSTAYASEGKLAVTHLRPLEVFGEYSLIECRLETGRTHQIRIHLSELGSPVCGDTAYRSRLGESAIIDRSGAPRLALHAHRLAFDHPETGERLSFEAPLPRDLTEWKTTLGR